MLMSTLEQQGSTSKKSHGLLFKFRPAEKNRMREVVTEAESLRKFHRRDSSPTPSSAQYCRWLISNY